MVGDVRSQSDACLPVTEVGLSRAMTTHLEELVLVFGKNHETGGLDDVPDVVDLERNAARLASVVSSRWGRWRRVSRSRVVRARRHAQASDRLPKGSSSLSASAALHGGAPCRSAHLRVGCLRGKLG